MPRRLEHLPTYDAPDLVNPVAENKTAIEGRHRRLTKRHVLTIQIDEHAQKRIALRGNWAAGLVTSVPVVGWPGRRYEEADGYPSASSTTSARLRHTTSPIQSPMAGTGCSAVI